VNAFLFEDFEAQKTVSIHHKKSVPHSSEGVNKGFLKEIDAFL